MLANPKIRTIILSLAGAIFLIVFGIDVLLDFEPNLQTHWYINQYVVSILLLLSFVVFAVEGFLSFKKLERSQHAGYAKQSLLEEVVNNLPVAIFAKDVKLGYHWVLWNKAAVDLLDLKIEKTFDIVDYDLFTKSEADFFRKTDEEVMAGGKTIDIPMEPVTTKNRGTWLSHTKKVPIYDKEGKPSILLGISEDITERKKAEEKFERFEAVIKYSDDAVIITTAGFDEPEPKILFVNEAFTKITGFSQNEALGKTPRILQGSRTDRGTLNVIRKAMRAKIPYTGEIINYHKDGSEYWLSLNIFPILDEFGQIKNFAAIERDITLNKLKEEEFQRLDKMSKQQDLIMMQRNRAEAANVAKSEFLANMSHELRTPLNSILGMTHLLKDTKLAKEQTEMLDTVNMSATALLAIVNDILDLSRIEANVITIEDVGIDLISLIIRTIDMLRPLTSRKGLVLTKKFTTKDIPFVLGDPVKIARVITNIIGNAIKYTDKGSVTAEINFYRKSDQEIDMEFKVSDTGIGIAADKLKIIFDKFTQVDDSPTRRYGGTGLGLAITKTLVELMGGAIEVESTPKVGSTFTTRIPFKVTNSLHNDGDRVSPKFPEVLHYLGVPVEKAKILVAEDHLLNQEFMKKVLQKFGFKHVDIVADGAAAVGNYKTHDYSVILMDCHMPEKSGYEATTDIRAIEKGTTKHIPIVALTANAMASDREKCLQAGMDDYMSKPFSPPKLKEILSQWITFHKLKYDLPILEDDIVFEERVPVVDLSLLESFSDNDKNQMCRFIGLFISQSVGTMLRLKENCSSGYNGAWIEAAHLLKSGATSLGATHLFALCEQAQAMANATESDRANQLAAIEKEMGLIKSFLVHKGLMDDKTH